MLRAVTLGAITSCLLVGPPAMKAAPPSGNYIEARTCQIYTGPCFANGEVGLTGKDAIMTWQINKACTQASIWLAFR